MVTTDYMLENLSKALNSESYAVPAFLVHGSTSTIINTDTSSLAGQYADVPSLTNSRSSNVVTFTGIKTGALVSGSSGDVLWSQGVVDTSSGGVLQAGVVLPSTVQTTSFDLEAVWEFTIDRV